MSRRILRLPAVLAKTGFSKSTIRRKELAGEFPRRVQCGENAVGWFAHEVEAYLEALPRKTLTGGIKDAEAHAENDGRRRHARSSSAVAAA
jgi:prophage regulatory protein